MEESITISRESYDRMVGEIKTLEKYNSRITAELRVIKDDNGVKTYVLRTIDSIRYQDHCDHHILTLDTDIQNIIDTVRSEAESTKDVLQDLRCLKSRMKGFWWSPSKPTATEKAKYCDEILDLVNKL